jgi:hypothetical protein
MEKYTLGIFMKYVTMCSVPKYILMASMFWNPIQDPTDPRIKHAKIKKVKQHSACVLVIGLEKSTRGINIKESFLPKSCHP